MNQIVLVFIACVKYIIAQLLDFHRADVPFTSTEVMHGQVITAADTRLSRFGREGAVLLKAHVDTTGAVTSIEVVQSPSQFLTNAALSSVRNWHYRVSYQLDKVVSVEETINFNFPPTR